MHEVWVAVYTQITSACIRIHSYYIHSNEISVCALLHRPDLDEDGNEYHEDYYDAWSTHGENATAHGGNETCGLL